MRVARISQLLRGLICTKGIFPHFYHCILKTKLLDNLFQKAVPQWQKKGKLTLIQTKHFIQFSFFLTRCITIYSYFGASGGHLHSEAQGQCPMCLTPIALPILNTIYETNICRVMIFSLYTKACTQYTLCFIQLKKLIMMIRIGNETREKLQVLSKVLE